jgi:hypothetical protein
MCMFIVFFSFFYEVPPLRMIITNDNSECSSAHRHLFFHLWPTKSGYTPSGPMFGICHTIDGCILLIFLYK